MSYIYIEDFTNILFNKLKVLEEFPLYELERINGIRTYVSFSEGEYEDENDTGDIYVKCADGFVYFSAIKYYDEEEYEHAIVLIDGYYEIDDPDEILKIENFLN